MSPISTAKGPAIAMKTPHHQQTASWGNSRQARAFRADQAKHIANGNFRAAQQMDIDDIRAKFGSLYDGAIKQMQEYTKGLGF